MTSNIPDLDLHKFIREPEKAREIIDLCIEDNLSRNIFTIRLVHGKGKGHFRDLIYSHLSKHPDVEGFTLCDPLHGGAGATWVHLRRRD